jgi:hypothetical protein
MLLTPDYCLGHFLRGVVQAVARYQPAEATASAKAPSKGDPSDEEIDLSAERDLKLVLEHGPDVQVSTASASNLTFLCQVKLTLTCSLITTLSITVISSWVDCTQRGKIQRMPGRTLISSCRVSATRLHSPGQRGATLTSR